MDCRPMRSRYGAAPTLCWMAIAPLCHSCPRNSLDGFVILVTFSMPDSSRRRIHYRLAIWACLAPRCHCRVDELLTAPPACPHGRLLCAVATQTHAAPSTRSEEHTSELQSLMRISYAVLCLQTKKNK